MKNEFDRFNIVSDDHLEKSIWQMKRNGKIFYQLSFFLLDQRSDGVHAASNGIRSFRCSIRFAALRLFISALFQTKFLFGTRFGTIFFQQFEQLGRRLFIERLSKLIDWWWNLQTFQQDRTLTLNANVLRPFDETR